MLTYLGTFATPAAASGWNYQSTAFNVSFVLWSAAGIMIGVAMLRSGVFGKVTGYLGIVGNVATFGLFVPVIGVWLSLVALPLLMVWYPLDRACGCSGWATPIGRGWNPLGQSENSAFSPTNAVVQSGHCSRLAGLAFRVRGQAKGET